MEEYKKTGTTTVGIVCSDGVILATEKRATMGFFIASKEAQKIFPIADKIAMTIAGGVGDAQRLIRWMKAEMKLYQLKHEREPSVKAAATLLANILSAYRIFPFFVQLLVAGVDDRGPRLFSVDMLGGVTEEKFAATGSGSPIAYGVLEAEASTKKSVRENLRVAVKAVDMAMKRDAGSGEGIDVAIITEEGVKKLEKDEVEALRKK